jgi:hypothetical protein
MISYFRELGVFLLAVVPAQSIRRRTLLRKVGARNAEHYLGQVVATIAEALGYVLGGGLESAFAGGYDEDQWHSTAEHLSEHVQNGLT